MPLNLEGLSVLRPARQVSGSSAQSSLTLCSLMIPTELPVSTLLGLYTWSHSFCSSVSEHEGLGAGSWHSMVILLLASTASQISVGSSHGCSTSHPVSC